MKPLPSRGNNLKWVDWEYMCLSKRYKKGRELYGVERMMLLVHGNEESSWYDAKFACMTHYNKAFGSGIVWIWKEFKKTLRPQCFSFFLLPLQVNLDYFVTGPWTRVKQIQTWLLIACSNKSGSGGPGIFIWRVWALIDSLILGPNRESSHGFWGWNYDFYWIC